MWFRGLSAFVALVAICSAAKADTLKQFQIAGWLAGAYSFEGTRNFSHCAASVSYRSGVYVVFSITRNYRWSFGLAHPNWNLSTGQSYNTAFVVDDLSPISAQAEAVDSALVKVELQDSAALFRKFMTGHELRVKIADRIFEFNLTDTSKVLPALLRCVQSYVEPPPTMSTADANPFGDSSKRAPTTARQSYRAEAVALAANILGTAGVSGFRILDEAPDRANRVEWVAGEIFGSLEINTEDNPEFIQGATVGIALASCKSKFGSGALPKEQSDIMRSFSICGEGEKARVSYYTIIQRDAGGYYLISTSSVGARQPAEQAESNIRTAAMKVVIDRK
jgi:hypothetical protein